MFPNKEDTWHEVSLCNISTFLEIINSISDSQKEGVKKESRRTSIESQQVGGEFAEFLKTLNKNAALDVSKQVRNSCNISKSSNTLQGQTCFIE